MWIPEYKKRWTASYHFERPVAAPAGTRIELIAQYDNTEDNWDNPNSPPIDVPSGSGSGEEQLMAMLSYTLDDHLNVQVEFVPPERPESEAGGGMLFTDVPILAGPDGAGVEKSGGTGPEGIGASEGGEPREDDG